MDWQPINDPRSFVACRTLGHSWDDNPVDRQRPKGDSVVITLRCTRCATQRIDSVSVLSGNVEGRRYKRPAGYLHKGSKSVKRADWRMAYMRIVKITKGAS